ncbi:LAFA_0F15302g1_1 [Lachancea sp. 'fantastica']|nr:LAFA_0F15302g1_1 [Lachancea sp. 'fantastica']
MSALIQEGSVVHEFSKFPNENNREKPVLQDFIPRSSPAKDEIRKLMSAENLTRDLSTKSNKFAVEQLQMLFEDQVKSVAVHFAGLQSVKTSQRIKLIVFRNRIREFLQMEANAAIETTQSPPEASISIWSDSYHSVVVECPLDRAFLQSLCGQKVCMLLSRELVHMLRVGHLELKASLVALNSRSVTLGGPNFEDMFEDMRNLVNNPFYKCPPKFWKAALAAESFDISSAMPRVLGAHKPGMVTHDITLNKAEITFLIGHLGTTIQQIREQSGATIKIIPIGSRLSAGQQKHPKSVEQHLSITGDIDSVTRAVCLIDAELALYRK